MDGVGGRWGGLSTVETRDDGIRFPCYASRFPPDPFAVTYPAIVPSTTAAGTDGTTTAAVGTVPIAAAVQYVFIRVGPRRGSDGIPIIFVAGRVRVLCNEKCRPTIGARSFDKVRFRVNRVMYVLGASVTGQVMLGQVRSHVATEIFLNISQSSVGSPGGPQTSNPSNRYTRCGYRRTVFDIRTREGATTTRT